VNFYVGSFRIVRLGIIASWKQKAKILRNETFALYLAYKDPRVSWYARIFMIVVITYALSPIDLIPDFIPLLGYLDDLIIVPLGIFLTIKMIPKGVMEECREKAKVEISNKRVKWIAAGIVIVIWLLVLILAVKFIWGIVSQN
jgi:uncharacterized membrane protein YkvA (DUF1232 family)